MIVKNELIKRIKGYFDLNIYETKVWLALLSKGISSAGEIALQNHYGSYTRYDDIRCRDLRDVNHATTLRHS